MPVTGRLSADANRFNEHTVNFIYFISTSSWVCMCWIHVHAPSSLTELLENVQFRPEHCGLCECSNIVLETWIKSGFYCPVSPSP